MTAKAQVATSPTHAFSSSMSACVELRDLRLNTDIGTYGPKDVVPDAHTLDLTLWLSPALVLIAQDGMSHVFDYDPLVAEIDRLAGDGHYETQERIITRIVHACACRWMHTRSTHSAETPHDPTQTSTHRRTAGDEFTLWVDARHTARHALLAQKLEAA
jgi:dihydroneopterin aldolase